MTTDTVAEENKTIEKLQEENQDLKTLILQMKEEQKTPLASFIKICAIIAIIVFMIFYAAFVTDAKVLDDLRDIEFARGIITLIIILGVISMGLMLVIAAFITDEHSKDKFYRAKEIFTILVGILGTIVGFYFGSGIDEDTPIKTSMTVSDIKLSNKTPNENSTIVISSEIKGGISPYEIIISSNPKVFETETIRIKKTGKFSHQLTLGEVKSNKESKVSVVIKDGNGKGKNIDEKTENITVLNVVEEPIDL